MTIININIIHYKLIDNMDSKTFKVSIEIDNWLEVEAQVITKMIGIWEDVEGKRQAATDSLDNDQLYPEVKEITNKCIKQISLALDEMWNEIQDAQRNHMKNIKKTKSVMMKMTKTTED